MALYSLIVLMCRHCLLSLVLQGHLDKAAAYYSSLVESSERCCGTSHPSVATALVNLAVVYSQLV